MLKQVAVKTTELNGCDVIGIIVIFLMFAFIIAWAYDQL